MMVWLYTQFSSETVLEGAATHLWKKTKNKVIRTFLIALVTMPKPHKGDTLISDQ